MCIDDVVLEVEMDEGDDDPAEDTVISKALLEIYDSGKIPPVPEKVELGVHATTALQGGSWFKKTYFKKTWPKIWQSLQNGQGGRGARGAEGRESP